MTTTAVIHSKTETVKKFKTHTTSIERTHITADQITTEIITTIIPTRIEEITAAAAETLIHRNMETIIAILHKTHHPHRGIQTTMP